MKKNIKKLTTVLLFGMFINLTFSQTETKILCYSIDDFDDTKSLLGGTNIMYTDNGDMKTEGLLIQNSLDDKGKKITYSTLIVNVYDKDINCVDEGNFMDVIFEDGSKIKLINWKSFNCEGLNYFDLSQSQLNDFKIKKIKGLRYTNKKDYKTITIKGNLNEENKTFLMNTLKEIDDVNNEISIVGVCK